MNTRYFFIGSSFFWKNRSFLFETLVFTFFLLNAFLISNAYGESYSSENQSDEIRIFLENLMIRDGGVYTLLGSKPMTEFDITGKIDETDEGIAKSYEEVRGFFEKKGRQPPTYEEHVKKCHLYRNDVKFRNRKELWSEWMHTYGSISTPVYKIIKREGNFTAGFFINVPNVLHILKKYHREFSQITGVQFDVHTILESIEDKESDFWEKVFRSHFLHGLLLGYGEKNAFLFEWVSKEALPMKAVSLLRFPELSSLDHHVKTVKKRSLTIEDLSIPYFVSFEIQDKEVERYGREREKIIDFMKEKDLTSFVLRCFGLV